MASIKIPLTQGEFALIDEEDLALIEPHTWHAEVTVRAGKPYKVARTNITVNGRSKTFRMHQFLVDIPKGMQIDHRNGNALDNRRENLRLATPSQNCQNRFRAGRSGFKGVWAYKKHFVAFVKAAGKHIYLGSAPTAEQAARLYDAGAQKYFGEFARLNFPEGG